MALGEEILPTVIFQIIFFFSIISVGIALLYISREISAKKKIEFPWILLVIGITISNMNQIINAFATLNTVEASVAFILGITTTVMGLAATIGGFVIIVLNQRYYEASNLRKRSDEIKATIKNLNEKFRSRQISEADLRMLSSGLIGELAQVEVKLEKSGKKTVEKDGESAQQS
jgi:hypothetical protein